MTNRPDAPADPAAKPDDTTPAAPEPVATPEKAPTGGSTRRPSARTAKPEVAKPDPATSRDTARRSPTRTAKSGDQAEPETPAGTRRAARPKPESTSTVPPVSTSDSATTAAPAVAPKSPPKSPAPPATPPTTVGAQQESPLDQAIEDPLAAAVVARTRTLPAPPPRPAEPRTAAARPAAAPFDPDVHREQFLRAYLRHRVGEKLAGFERTGRRHVVARRATTGAGVLLFTGAAALGAVAVADPGRRALWGLLATACAALAGAVAVYETAFSSRVLARRSAGGAAVLALLQAHGAPEGDAGVAAFRAEVESALRHSG
ncbi:hypothetical protein [Actinosynnema sp. NPDC020468]|uniref:hypothetical protein n=1 Tax=Actinosynnema sp. NPDC020468 TaxID=3154488 RepID=UPI0033E5CBEB